MLLMARIRQGIYPHPFSNCCEKNAHHFIEIFAVVVVIFFFLAVCSFHRLLYYSVWNRIFPFLGKVENI